MVDKKAFVFDTNFIIENKDEEIESITDLDNICFMGTNVISGSGKGVCNK